MTRDEHIGFWLVALAVALALTSSCAAAPCTSHPYDPKCCLGIPCYREPLDAGPAAR